MTHQPTTEERLGVLEAAIARLSRQIMAVAESGEATHKVVSSGRIIAAAAEADAGTALAIAHSQGATLNAVRQDQQDLRAEMNRRFDDVDEQLNNLDEKLTDRVEGLARQLAEVLDLLKGK